MVVDCTTEVRKQSETGLFPPSLLCLWLGGFCIGIYLREHVLQLGGLIPSLIMTYSIALNKTFNLIYKMGTIITSSGGYGEEQRTHI